MRRRARPAACPLSWLYVPLLFATFAIAAPAATEEQGASAGGVEVPAESRAEGLRRSRRSTGEDSALMAPIGVTDSYTLQRGEWGFSYRYTRIHFDDMRQGTRRRDTESLLGTYNETPRDRDLDVHLFGISFAPHRRVTLSAKLPLISQETNLTAASPRERFETKSSGIGDLELRVLIPFMRKDAESLQIELGLTAPTGSTGRRDAGAGGVRDRLSFPQQLGSGTVDLLVGVVYRGRWQTLSWGLLGRSRYRFYENTHDYKLGNEHTVSTWIAQSWTDWMSTSLRMSWQRRENVSPGDQTLVNPERDPKRQAGDLVDIGPGVNFRVPWRMPGLGDPRFGVEMTWPFFQSLKGPQLERDWQLTAGWEWAF